MKTITYQIEFFTLWHVSSGLSGSTYADLLVNKTDKGLPYIPGKTLKGLLREAAECLNELNSDYVSVEFIQDLFGENPRKGDTEEETFSKEAKCFFSNAYLSQHLTTAIPEQQIKYLYQVVASTAIDDNGLAKGGSLRQLEVTVPLNLYANIEHFPDKEDYTHQLEHCLKWVKRMGLNRTRGLGRCHFSILKIQ